MNKAKTIGMIWAICDHFEQNTGRPVSSSTLKAAAGIDRTQIRKWVREGRLAEYNIISNGRVEKGYARPKQGRTEHVSKNDNGGGERDNI